MEPIPSHDLVRRLAERRSDDWRLFLERHGPVIQSGLVRVCLRAGRRLRRAEREDLEQEVCCRLLKAAAGFRGGSDGQVERYLECMITSVSTDFLRRDLAAKRRLPMRIDGSLPDAAGGRRRALEAEAPSPEEEALERDLRRAGVARCLELLETSSRPAARALDLVLFEGLTSRQASRRLGAPWTPQRLDRLVFELRRRLLADGVVLPRRRGGREPRPAAAS